MSLVKTIHSRFLHKMAAAQVNTYKEQIAAKSNLEFIADNIIKKVNSSYCLKKKQLDCIKNVVGGKDTLAILPTAYGKSMIYQMLPLIYKSVSSGPKHPIVLVVCPLQSLIHNQIAEAEELSSYLGIKACSLDTCSDVESMKLNGYNIVFGIPEKWLSSSVKDFLSTSFLRRNVVCVVVDEAHKISW